MTKWLQSSGNLGKTNSIYFKDELEATEITSHAYLSLFNTGMNFTSCNLKKQPASCWECLRDRLPIYCLSQIVA